MLRRSWPILIPLALAAGCASPPQPEPGYAGVAGQIQLAAAQVEPSVPATLASEPELNGAHPVDFYVQLALQRNPAILAAQRTVAAQAETIPQVTALEDPMLSDTFWPDPDHSPQTASGGCPIR